LSDFEWLEVFVGDLERLGWYLQNNVSSCKQLEVDESSYQNWELSRVVDISD